MMATYLQVNNMDEYDDLDTCDGAPVHTSYTYDRRGNVLTERSVHTPRGQAPIVREVTSAYNAAGRVARRRVTENGSEAEMSFTYDDCGRLASERMSNGVTRRYTYNIHGWPELTETVVPVELQADKDSVVTILPHLSPLYYRRLPPNVDSTKLEPINPPSVKPIVFTKTYTDRMLYTDGAHPRYGGSPSARINSLGGRYDYSYDPHDRLVCAIYSPGENSDDGEDFSTYYSYDELSRPLEADRMGVIAMDADGVEYFGSLDELTYRYDESGALESIHGSHGGEEYYGRPGYPATDGTYTWNNAGCMKSDSSRGICNITYNYRNLPSTVEFEDGSRLQHYYNADGVLLRSMVRRPGTGVGLIGSTMKTVSSRDYIADRVFNKGKLEYSYFPGGYFDGGGGVHYLHSDYQGSVVMVTDSVGRVEQHNTYYPYGEPHRLPSGQRRLYCGKERESVTGEYDYGARLHFAPGLLWTVPDALANLTPQYSPYVFCAANPIRYIDENGMKWEDPKVEEDLLNLIEICINKLQKGIEKEKVKIGRLESKGKDTTKSMDKIEDFNNRIDYLNRNKDNVKRLGTDQDNIYAIGSTAGDGVNTVRKDEDGKVVIQADGTARILHEITHIVQSLDTGGLLFSNNSILCNAGITFPREERDGMIAEYEVEAYRNQYAYNPYSLLKLPQSLNHINQEYVSSIIVNGKPAYSRISDHTRRLKKGSDK